MEFLDWSYPDQARATVPGFKWLDGHRRGCNGKTCVRKTRHEIKVEADNFFGSQSAKLKHVCEESWQLSELLKGHFSLVLV